jgi:hypothetical protein
MGSYWAQENWPTRTAVVHRADCAWCKNGIGIQGGGTGKNNVWYGPFSTQDEARAACLKFEPRGCRKCRPEK